MYIHVNNVNLFYEKTGEGRPLIMVHGNSEDHTIFNEAVRVLKEYFTCYCVDSRGHGYSMSANVLHYDDMAEDMIAFMEKLDLRDVTFYGFSDGGIIGLLAAARTDRISTLIVSGANLTPKGVKAPLRLLFKGFHLVKKDPKIEMMLNEPHIDDELLKKITAKTLVLAGSKDLVTEKETRHIAETVPGAELEILLGEGHGSYIIHKEKIAEIILRFTQQDADPDSIE